MVVTVLGEVDISTVDDLRYALESARDAPAAEIWLDLSAATFFDCRGLSTLLELRPGLLAGNRRLAVICPPGPVRRLLDLTGADSELEIHSSPAAATRPWRPRIAR